MEKRQTDVRVWVVCGQRDQHQHQHLHMPLIYQLGGQTNNPIGELNQDQLGWKKERELARKLKFVSVSVSVSSAVY